MAIDGADVFTRTIDAISDAAPAIVASAARELGEMRLNLIFGDHSTATLTAQKSSLLAHRMGEGLSDSDCDVEVHFDDRALLLLFDAAARPSEQSFEQSLDMRGSREALLACWRCFSLLARRASGLRTVQAIWSAYRDQSENGYWRPDCAEVGGSSRTDEQPREDSCWPALSWLESRYPAGRELIDRGESVLSPARSIWNGRDSASWQSTPDVFDNDLRATMQQCKEMVIEEILRLMPNRRPKADLYDLMKDYVVREGKGLRPTLVIAACLAHGGRTRDGVRAAAALEMFHNGFLVHDDIADESTHRRGKPTLHTSHGIGLAVNAGDAMHLFAVDMTLSNLETLGLARTLGLIQEILNMCRETVEGQAIELSWIRRNFVPKRDSSYSHMSTKKTGWYTTISPCRIGAVAAGVTDSLTLSRYNEAFRLVGIAFQIQDDVLNLVGETELYGKEALGDLLEGKRTVMMIHLFRTAGKKVVDRMRAINALSRNEKQERDAEAMLAAMHACGSITYATQLADRLANEGVRRFEKDLGSIDENPGKAVLRQVANYVTTRAL